MTRPRGTQRIPAYHLYGEAPRRIPDTLLHIETIEARSAGHHWRIQPHVHQALHQLIFVVAGRGVVLAEGTRAQYRPPALLLLPAGSVHGFEFEPGTTGHVVSISASLLQELALREDGLALLFSRPATLELSTAAVRATDLARGIRRLAQEFTRAPAASALVSQGWLQVLLGNALRLARDLPHPADAVTVSRRLLVARFNELVERRYREDQAIGAYAAALRISASRLRNACLATTGQSPIQLIHARLLLEAKRQLHYTDRPVGEVARTLGFGDAAYFTRFFSRRAGVSPRAFRQRGGTRGQLSKMGVKPPHIMR